MVRAVAMVTAVRAAARGEESEALVAEARAVIAWEVAVTAVVLRWWNSRRRRLQRWR